jgi:hypothetical protein
LAQRSSRSSICSVRGHDSSSEHFDELGEPGGVVGDPFLGDQLAAFVDDGDVVVGSA